MEQNHLNCFGIGAKDEHLSEIILKLAQWSRRRCHLNKFLMTHNTQRTLADYNSSPWPSWISNLHDFSLFRSKVWEEMLKIGFQDRGFSTGSVLAFLCLMATSPPPPHTPPPTPCSLSFRFNFIIEEMFKI